MTEEPKKISKGMLKTIARYMAQLEAGERIMRDATGKVQWSSGKAIGGKTFAHMMEVGMIRSLDTDLFSNPHRGQTIGIPQ